MLAVVLVVLIGVYVIQQRKTPTYVTPPTTMAPGGGPNATPGQQSSGPGCASPAGASAASVPTQEFGKKGAKVEIVAALPITHGCHVQTEAELKKAYKAHPKDVHLVIYDLFGKDGQAYVKKKGGTRAVIFIDGKSTFKHAGKVITLEKQENDSYHPGDIGPIVSECVKQKAIVAKLTGDAGAC